MVATITRILPNFGLKINPYGTKHSAELSGKFNDSFNLCSGV
jgi:hypothetical protein